MEDKSIEFQSGCNVWAAAHHTRQTAAFFYYMQQQYLINQYLLYFTNVLNFFVILAKKPNDPLEDECEKPQSLRNNVANHQGMHPTLWLWNDLRPPAHDAPRSFTAAGAGAAARRPTGSRGGRPPGRNLASQSTNRCIIGPQPNFLSYFPSRMLTFGYFSPQGTSIS